MFAEIPNKTATFRQGPLHKTRAYLSLFITGQNRTVADRKDKGDMLTNIDFSTLKLSLFVFKNITLY